MEKTEIRPSMRLSLVTKNMGVGKPEEAVSKNYLNGYSKKTVRTQPREAEVNVRVTEMAIIHLISDWMRNS